MNDIIQAAIITTLVYAYQGEMAKKTQFLWGATGHNCKGRSMVELDDYSIPMPAELYSSSLITCISAKCSKRNMIRSIIISLQNEAYMQT